MTEVILFCIPMKKIFMKILLASLTQLKSQANLLSQVTFRYGNLHTALCTWIHLLSKPNIFFLHHIFHRRGSEGYPINCEITEPAGFSYVRGLVTAINDAQNSLSYTSGNSKVGLSQGMQLQPHDEKHLR